MAETVSQGNWQSIGSTIPQEYRFVTHLQDTPPLANNLKRATSIRRNYSVRSTNRGGSPTPGGASLKRHNAVRLTTKAKIIRFLRRFTWNRRSKGYLFGKSYLQRQPSLVITPDLSSFSYHFSNRDLAKRKPGPHYKRTSQPVAAWKNMNPMDVLMGTQVDVPRSHNLNGRPSSRLNSRSNSRTNSRPDSRPSSRPNSGHHRESANSNSTEPFRDLMTKEPDEAEGVPNWVRISLPVKQIRNKKLSHSDDSRSTDEEQKQNAAREQQNTKQETESPVRRERTGVDDSRKGKTTSWIDTMPQTPVQAFSSREFGSNLNSKNSSTPSGDRTSSGRSNFLAYAVTATPPESPTALPSSYRPESWRKSAILTRDGRYPQNTASSASIDGLASTWSMYIRQAVAQRAVDSKERRSRELENELRWSQNQTWDSEDESIRSGIGLSSFNGCRGGSTSSADTKSSVPASVRKPSSQYIPTDVPEPITPAKQEADRDDDTLDFNEPKHEDFYDSNGSSGSIPKTPIQHTRPNSTLQTVSPLNAAYAVTTHEDARSPTLVRVKSPSRQSTTKLAPLNSPRAMASASALASAVSLAAAVQGNHSQAETNVESTELDNSQWLKETGSPSDSAGSSTPSSVASSSLFNEDDYIFPSHDQYTTVPSSTTPGNHSVNKEASNYGIDRHHQSRPSIGSEEFDFSKRITSRKRPLPPSPASTPPRSPELEAIRANLSNANALKEGPVDDNASKHTHRESVDSTRSMSSVENSESAPTIVRSQSQWKQRSLSQNHVEPKKRSVLGQKRIKSSGSKDHLLHTRRKTMESQWDEEEESE